MVADAELPAEWTTTVIDITGTSRFGGRTDTAEVETVVRLGRPPADPLGLVPDDATVELLAGDGLTVRIRSTLDVTADDGVFALSVDIPPPGVVVRKGGAIDAVALLPAVPGEPVTVRSVEPDVAEVFDGERAPLVGGRTAVAFHLDADPTFIVRYIYG